MGARLLSLDQFSLSLSQNVQHFNIKCCGLLHSDMGIAHGFGELVDTVDERLKFHVSRQGG
ncbi:hypothetical protein PGTUg99_036507 [Puccinia graminis f. sp. tritici]|uniref:Uncharacterized protein n=1 Tax=Puccinia graminis f. sp. tritici TaxID=56615 RepID=A0A5B0RRF8_PUCGR|nr:hypothetical protein PGTUg99_036507 [Puccinia graminis f. sp. tritici]